MHKKKITMKDLRKLATRASVSLLFLCLSAPASAISIAVVGSVDKFLDSTVLSNSGKSEETWASSVLGFAVSIDYKTDPVLAAGWEFVSDSSDSDHWAYLLGTDPAHYVLKLGVGSSGADTHYLFENLASLSWAVIDLSEMLAGQQLAFNFGRVSHIAETGVGIVNLREPGTIGLLIIGLALFSVAIALRRKGS